MMANRPIPKQFLKKFNKRVQDRLAEINPFICALRKAQQQRKQQHENGSFSIAGAADYAIFDIRDVEEVLPSPLAVGDRVTLTIGGDCPNNVHGEIVATKNDWFWVLHDYGFATVRSDELRRAEGA